MSTTFATPPPLTTTFTPAASCLTDIYLSGTPGGVYYYSLGPSDPSDCFPSGWTPTTTAFFSPGLFCPHGYSGGCTSMHTIGTETETTATCCPNGYSCFKSGVSFESFFQGQACTLRVTSPGYVTVTSSAAIGVKITTLYANTMDGVNAYGVALHWQSSDLVTSSSTSLSTTTSQTPAITTSLPSTSTTGPSTGQVGSSGLSIGAKAGIGVGVAFGSLLALSCAVFLLLKSKRKPDGPPAAGSQELGGSPAWKIEQKPNAREPFSELVELTA